MGASCQMSPELNIKVEVIAIKVPVATAKKAVARPVIRWVARRTKSALEPKPSADPNARRIATVMLALGS